MIFRSLLLLGVSVAALHAGANSGASTLLAGETQGLALDFTDDHFYASTGHYGSARVLDAGTPANDYDSSPTTTSASLLTYTSPSLKMTMGPNGTLRFGAHNLLLQSEDFTNASWTKSGATAPSANVVTDASGAASGFASQAFTLVAGGTYTYYLRVTKDAVASSTRFVDFRVLSTSNHDLLFDTSSGLYANINTAFQSISVVDAGASWDVSLSFIANAASTTVYIFPAQGTAANIQTATGANFSAATTGSVTVTRVGLRRTPSDSTYLATAAAARYALPYEWGANLASGTATQAVTVEASTGQDTRCYAIYYEGSGSVVVSGGAQAWLAPGLPTHVKPGTTSLTLTVTGSVTKLSVRLLLGILVEEARTDLCLYSDDLTNAAWTKSNATAAKTATGPDGVANSASTLTATAGNATCLQSITSASAARVTSCYIKRRTGTGNIDMTQDNGTTWATVTVTSSWTRVSIASATVTNPIVGLRIVTSGDAVDVALFDHEVGAFVTSPIPTLGSTVTRAVDNISLATSAFPWSATDATLFVELTNPQGANANGDGVLLHGGSNAHMFGFTQNGGLYALIRTASSDQTAMSASAVPTSNATPTKVALAASANDVAWVSNGGAAVTDASATMPTVTTLSIFKGTPNYTGVDDTYRIRKIMVLPRRMSNADMQSLTAA